MDFLPTSDNGLVTWCTSHITKVGTQTAPLNLSATIAADETASCNTIIAAINAADVAKNSYESAVTHKNTVLTTEKAKIRNFAKDVKRNGAYTDAIGSDLGIVSTSTTFDAAGYKSVIKVENHPGYVLAKFTKKGAEGINLYGRLRGETTWNKLSFFAHSPCIDARPLAVPNQAENREYMCIGVKRDAEIGLQSDIVSIAFAG
jgi:hypothetical protein